MLWHSTMRVVTYCSDYFINHSYIFRLQLYQFSRRCNWTFSDWRKYKKWKWCMRQGTMGGVLAISKSHPLLIESGSVARENLFAFVHFWMNQTNSPILELTMIFRIDFLKIIFSWSAPSQNGYGHDDSLWRTGDGSVQILENRIILGFVVEVVIFCHQNGSFRSLKFQEWRYHVWSPSCSAFFMNCSN